MRTHSGDWVRSATADGQDRTLIDQTCRHPGGLQTIENRTLPTATACGSVAWQ